MDAKQAAVFGIFTGMAINDNKSDFIDINKVNIYALKILKELDYPLPSEDSIYDFHKFVNELNSLCSDIMWK
jgi:hypothetical protein